MPDDDLLRRFGEAFEAGRHEEALAILDDALAVDPGDVGAYLARAKVLMVLDREDEALATFDRLEAAMPGSAAPHYERGVLLQELGREEEALAAYSRATEVDPDDPAGWVNRGRLLDEDGRCDEAVACYRRVLTLVTDDAEAVEIARCNLGNSLNHLWRFEDALEAFDAALAEDPESAPARLGRATALAALGRIEEANAANPAGTPHDRGELRERRAPAGERDLVIRYWTGRHSNPELLDGQAERILELCAPLKNEGPGLADGVTIGLVWTILTVRELGGDYVLSEPEFSRNPFDELSPELSFTLQTALMHGMLHAQTGAPVGACTFTDGVALAPGVLDEDEVVLVRQHETDEDGFSGWCVGPVDPDAFAEAFAGEEVDVVPGAALVGVRPHLIKVLTLPAGWSARFEGHRVVSVRDPDGGERWRTGAGGGD